MSEKLRLKKCMECGSYTLKDFCSCGGKTVSPKPPKYSPEDKYARYRRAYKEARVSEDQLL